MYREIHRCETREAAVQSANATSLTASSCRQCVATRPSALLALISLLTVLPTAKWKLRPSASNNCPLCVESANNRPFDCDRGAHA